MATLYLRPALQSYQRSSRGKTSLRRRCLSIMKQQRTRIYILHRCVTMLLCWRDHN
ncbi:small polypeptide DEVIL 10 [Silene latifolia]|uniref:small polypeptide DEVIL 10 n=1 Tax=Silene latifolia TaxID=37657 RepID=UPI003D7839B8